MLGERDMLVPGSVEEDLRGLVGSGVEIARLKGCAHAPFISHPAAILELIEVFFGNRDE